jgi:hypothetical protein
MMNSAAGMASTAPECESMSPAPTIKSDTRGSRPESLLVGRGFRNSYRIRSKFAPWLYPHRSGASFCRRNWCAGGLSVFG